MRMQKSNAVFSIVMSRMYISILFAFVAIHVSWGDGIVDGRIGESYGSTRAIDSGNDVTGDGECINTAGRGNVMDFFAMSIAGGTGGTNDPWYFTWTVDSSHSLIDTTGNFFGNPASNRVNYLIGVEVNCDGAPRLEMWQDGQPWEREFAWNVDYFIAMFATGPDTMEAQLWRNDGGNNRSMLLGGITVTSRVVGFRRQIEFSLPVSAAVPVELRNNSNLCLYLLAVRDVEGSGTVLDGVGLLNHNINCQGAAFDLSSLGSIFIDTAANCKTGGRPTDPGLNSRQCLSNPDRSAISSVQGQPCEGPFGISIDGQIDSRYVLLTESAYAAPYSGGAANASDFVGESSARTYTYISGGITNTVILPAGQHGDIANLHVYGDTNYLYLIVSGPTALGWELEPDQFNLFVAIDMPGQTSGNNSGSSSDLAPGSATAPANRLVNFKGWDPDYVVELVWRGVAVGIDTPGNLYAATGSGAWSNSGTFLYQNIANTATGAVALYYSRTFPQYEFAIPWNKLGRSGPPLSSENIRLGAYTTADENIEAANVSRWDVADQSPGLGQGCSGEGCHERVGDDALDDDALNSTGLGDHTPFVGRSVGAPGFAPATDNSTNDVDTIEEYFAFNLNVGICAPGVQIEKFTNNEDADHAPGPTIGVGSIITWTYVVSNPGNVSLTNVVLTDDKIGIISGPTSGDLNGNQLLDVGETWTYSATGTVIAGQYVNTGTVTAVSLIGQAVTDNDPAHYFGSMAGFNLNKTVISQTNRPAIPGEAISFTISVVNTGNVTLVTVPVTDLYETNYLLFQHAIPPSDDVMNDGLIQWANAGPLSPGSSTSIVVHFIAVQSFAGIKTNKATANPLPVSGHPPLPPQTSSAPYQVQATAALGDFIWNDVNGNGIQDSGEPGISNVLVSLYDVASNQIAMTTTGTNGVYAFTNLIPGAYFVGFTAPPGYQVAAQDQGGNDNLDSDISPLTLRTILTTLIAGENDVSWDAGFYIPASAGDFVWLDINRNGVQDINESGYGNVRLSLYDSNNAVVAVTTSQVNGAYAFTNLPPGNYYIRIHVFGAITITPQFQGGDDELDSNVFPFSALTSIFTLLSGENDITIDVGLYESLILAQVYRVSGELSGVQPVLVWETDSEYGTAGWYIEREIATGVWEKVGGLLPAIGTHLSGARYTWPDPMALAGGTYRYRIVEVEARGELRTSITYEVTYPKSGRRIVSSAPATFSAQVKTYTPEVTELPVHILSGSTGAIEAVKVGVKETGLHVVTAAQIAGILGVPEATVASSPMRVENFGLEIPAQREGGSVKFFARAYSSFYTDQNIYRISLGASTPISSQAVAPAPGTPTGTYLETVRLEQQSLLLPALFDNAADDIWLWRRLISGLTNNTEFTTSLVLPNLAAGTGGNLLVRVKGGSQSSGNGMHGVRVELNGQVLGRAQFFALHSHDLFLSVAPGQWADTNQLKVITEAQAGVMFDHVYIDWIAATYTKSMVAKSNRLVFTASAGPVQVDGFSSAAIDVWDVTDQWNPVKLTGFGQSTGSVNFVAPRTGRYIASASNLTAASLVAWHGNDLKDNTHEVDYLVIYGAGLSSGAEALAADRTSKGLRTKAVSVESIYDAFNHGIRDARVIKTFLNYSYRQWETSPRYVVLAGDSSYDYLNRVGADDCLVPTPPEGGAAGVYASDHSIGDLNGDGILDMAVGRIPVTSALQLSGYLAKLQAFEQGGAWRDKVMVSTDNPDTGGDFFSNGNVIENKITTKTVERADIALLGAEAAANALQAGLNQGREFTMYIGHGYRNQLAVEAILTTSDVPELNNTDKPGIVMALGCLMGSFGEPGSVNIGEKLVNNQSGASAMLGSASLVNNNDGNELGGLLVDELYNEETPRLGDAWVNAKNSLVGRLSYYGAKAYQLLGDPSLAIGDAHSPRGGPDVHPTRPSYDEWLSWAFAPVWLEQGLSTNPSADPDRDGLTNWEEYMAGTDPLDALSDLVVVTVKPQSNGTVTLTWDSVPGRQYRIERASTVYGTYTTIQDNVPAAAPINAWTDTTPMTSAAFYRVYVK